MSRLQQRPRVESVVVLAPIRPPEGGEGEETGGEPRVENVLVLAQADLGLVRLELLGRLLQGLGLRATGDPIGVLAGIGRWLALYKELEAL